MSSPLALAHDRPPPAGGRFGPDALAEARGRADPLADAALVELLASGRSLRRPAAAARALADEGSPGCAALVARLDAQPAWADPEAMRAGAEAGLRHFGPASLALLMGSLPESYANAAGAKVLARAGRLTGDTQRRVMETVQWVADLGLARGPAPGSAARDGVLAVRLMHARVRATCLAGGWDTARWGQPVNQEDLLHTLTLFSHVLRRGLEALGVGLGPAEHAGIQACWRLTGLLLGVDEALLPTAPDEEEQAYLATSARRAHPDEDSRALTAALVRAMCWRPPFLLPPEVLEAAGRRLVGDALADALGLRRHANADRLVALAVRGLAADRALVRRVPGLDRGRVLLGERAVGLVVRSGLPRRTTFGL